MSSGHRDSVPRELSYLSRWARARGGSASAWSGIDRGVAPPFEYRPLPPITEDGIRDAAAKLARWHEVWGDDTIPLRYRWLRSCYCDDGKHGR